MTVPTHPIPQTTTTPIIQHFAIQIAILSHSWCF